MKQLTETEALNKTAALCSTTEYCRHDIAEKLKRWNVDYLVIERVLTRLEAERYIDEERFCRAFINDKYRFAKWGRQKIAQALQLKKIPSSTFRPLLNEIDEEEYLSILSQLLAAKRRSVKAESDYELNGKLIRFALGRGYEMKEICSILKTVDENDWND